MTQNHVLYKLTAYSLTMPPTPKLLREEAWRIPEESTTKSEWGRRTTEKACGRGDSKGGVKTIQQPQACHSSFTVYHVLSRTSDILAVDIYLKGCCGEEGLAGFSPTGAQTESTGRGYRKADHSLTQQENLCKQHSAPEEDCDSLVCASLHSVDTIVQGVAKPCQEVCSPSPRGHSLHFCPQRTQGGGCRPPTPHRQIAAGLWRSLPEDECLPEILKTLFCEQMICV